jgi:hypothetical protein
MAQPPVLFDPKGYPANDSLKIIVGTINIRESRVSLTTNLNELDIYSLPYDLEPGLTISSIDKNGTVSMSYGNESVDLQSGHTWKSPVISTWNETNTIKYPPPDWSTGIDNGTNYTYTVRFVRTWTIENKGVFDK